MRLQGGRGPACACPGLCSPSTLLMGIGRADAPSRCSPPDWPLPEKSCGSPGWWETVNVCSILQVIQIFTVTPLWGDKLCHFDFLQRNLSVRSDGSHSECVKEHSWLQGEKPFDIISSWLMILFYAFPSSLVVYRDRNSLKRKRNNIRYFFF